ncbi:DNA polymerase I, partial [Candidatus Azambacteria bacterium]|nr:DNA polymerase I [Candidatus Azambacteria bacterium]
FKFKKTKTGKISTEHNSLEKLSGSYEVIKLILKYRELAKIKNTYVDSLIAKVDEHSRIHTVFSQTGTATGRLTSSHPNLQNLPKTGEWGEAVRQAIIAEKGYQLVSFDYSQLELRLAAHLANEKRLIQAFNEGQDIHRLTAASIYKLPLEEISDDQRRQAKIFNFGILYGMSKKSLAQSANLSLEEASTFIDNYFKSFPALVRFIEEAKDEARKTGIVRTLFGRLRRVTEVNAANWSVRGQAERVAVNFKIQGLNADIIKLAMIEIDKHFSSAEDQDNIRLILQVHDELVFEIKDELIESSVVVIKNIMENFFQFKVPLVVNYQVGSNLGF